MFYLFPCKAGSSWFLSQGRIGFWCLTLLIIKQEELIRHVFKANLMVSMDSFVCWNFVAKENYKMLVSCSKLSCHLETGMYLGPGKKQLFYILVAQCMSLDAY